MLKKIIIIGVGLLLAACGGSGGGGSGTPTPTVTPTPTPTPTGTPTPGGYIKGVNYDPAHSQSYISGQNSGNIAEMQTSIDADLQQISNLGFTVIKSYYSEYCTGTTCINIADEVAKYPKLKLAIGVFEFQAGNPRSWTSNQVNAAITAVNNHPDEIVAIVVGNEDIESGIVDSNGNNIGDDIVTDINMIKAGITGTVPPIGTAQTQNTWMNPSALPSGLLNTITYAGANIYPFFGGVNSGVVAANSIPTSVAQIVSTLKNAGYTGQVAVTEEGFASSGVSTLTVFPSQQNETEYYNTWKNRQDTFDSYYFSMYDFTTQIDPNNVNNYFGLCSISGGTKSIAMLNCGS